jgi:hypothetical protein
VGRQRLTRPTSAKPQRLHRLMWRAHNCHTINTGKMQVLPAHLLAHTRTHVELQTHMFCQFSLSLTMIVCLCMRAARHGCSSARTLLLLPLPSLRHIREADTRQRMSRRTTVVGVGRAARVVGWMWDVGCHWEYAGRTLWPTLSKWARLWAYAGWWRRQPSGWCGGPPHLACLVEVPKLDGFVVEVKIRKKNKS